MAKEPPKPDQNELQATIASGRAVDPVVVPGTLPGRVQLQGCRRPPTAGQAIDSTDMAALEGIILAKLKDKALWNPENCSAASILWCPNSQQCHPQRLKSNGLVIDDPDGRLAAAAATVSADSQRVSATKQTTGHEKWH